MWLHARLTEKQDTILKCKSSEILRSVDMYIFTSLVKHAHNNIQCIISKTL